jgi:hypothetical protein
MCKNIKLIYTFAFFDWFHEEFEGEPDASAFFDRFHKKWPDVSLALPCRPLIGHRPITGSKQKYICK